MFGPQLSEENGVLFSRIASQDPGQERDIETLQTEVDDELDVRNACSAGICRIREDIYSSAFLEIIRQVSISCRERGMLLLKVKNELDTTINAYKRIYQSVVDHGARERKRQGKSE